MISPRFVLLANKWNCACGIHSTQRNRGYENIILFTKPLPMQDKVLQKMCGFEPQLLRCILSPRSLHSRWFTQGRAYKQATRAAMPQMGWGGSRCTALCPNKLNHQLRRLKSVVFLKLSEWFGLCIHFYKVILYIDQITQFDFKFVK